MKIDIKEFAGKIAPVKENDRYSLHDLQYLEHLTVCMNILHPEKSTFGHDHSDVDEVLLVMDGKGEFQLDNRRFPIETGDIILIKGGQFHQTINNAKEDLVFLTIFEKYEGRGGKKPVKYAKKPEPAKPDPTQNYPEQKA